MALNTHLTLTLDGTPVVGGVTQKGKEGTIMVTSFDWSFDSDGNVAEIKFTGELDKETPVISAGLKSSAVVDALFDFYEPNVGPGGTGAEIITFKLHGTNGKVTSVNLWMMNNKDATLTRYATTIQYTMSFQAIQQTWVQNSATVTIP
jgi:type VI protein secretion system component Hcp